MVIQFSCVLMQHNYDEFVFVKGRHFTFFTHLINSKLISELVSSGNTVFLRINATQV